MSVSSLGQLQYCATQRNVSSDGVFNPESAASLDYDKALDELRSKLCQMQPVEKKRWRFW
jgi:hypothetical protein